MVYEKKNNRGDCLKKRAWTVCRFTKGLGQKHGVFLREGLIDTAIHTMANLLDLINKFLFPVKSSENHIFLMISREIEVN